MVQSANRLKRSPAFRTGLARRAVPFAIAALVGLAVGPLPPNGVALTPFLLAAGLTAMLLATVVFVPWDRWSPDVQIILPLAYLGVVAMLREAGGGTQAGVAVLVLLPVMWVSLYGRRRELFIVLAASGATLVLPLLLQRGDRYQRSDVVRATMVVVVGAAIGLTTQRLVRQVARSASELRRTVDTSLDAFVAVDSDGAIVEWTTQAESLFGWTAEQAVGQSILDRCIPVDRRAEVAGQLDFLRSRSGDALPRSRTEAAAQRADGSTFLAEFSVTGVETDTGFRYNAFVRDVTELRRVNDALRASEAHFRELFDDAPIGMALQNLDGRFTMVNDALCEMTGYSSEQLTQMTYDTITHPDDLAVDQGQDRRLVAGEIRRYDHDKRYIHAHGHAVWVSVHVTLIRDAGAEPLYFLLQAQDVTQRRNFENQLQHLADHDPLTGLLNRRGFDAELQRHVRYIKRYGCTGALLALDLDGFKYINDTLGHNAGDELVVAVAQVLVSRIRSTDFVARVGGDEFAILLPHANIDQAALVADGILNAVRDAALLNTSAVRPVTVSIGIAEFSSTEVTGDEVLVNADMAMYDAKEAGRNRISRYSTEDFHEPRIKARVGWLDRIAAALKNDGFAFELMPILNLATNEVEQYELLLRMRGDNGEIIPPASFLYIAERFDAIHEIDRWVTCKAIDVLATHADQFSLAVNLSGKSLADPELLPLIETELARTGVAPCRLTFELTETSAVADILGARRFGERLHEIGCSFALDDFGAGFGSFYYLKHLPFDYLKIDGEFVKQCATNRTDQLIIESLVALAQGMNKQTVAEYTGSDEAVDFLRRAGVDHAQGFHIGKPMPIESFFPAAR